MDGIINDITIDLIPFFIESGCPSSPHVWGNKGHRLSLKKKHHDSRNMKIKYLTTNSRPTGTSISIVTGCSGIGLDWIYRLIVKCKEK